MIQTTRWSPDTCKCVIEYVWDDATDESKRTHTVSEIVSRCPEHPHANINAVYNAVVAENRGKNEMLEEVKKSFPELTDANGNLKDDAVAWDFDGQRNLVLNIPSLSRTQKDNFQASQGARIGQGKIKVN